MTIVTDKILPFACVVGVFFCPTEQASVRERRSREGIEARKSEEESIQGCPAPIPSPLRLSLARSFAQNKPQATHKTLCAFS